MPFGGLVALIGFNAGYTTAVASAETIADGQMALDAGRPVDARQIWTGLAEHGNGEAAYLIGLLYDLGKGVSPDAAAAYCWYLRGAEAGWPAAAHYAASSWTGFTVQTRPEAGGPGG
jgi:TPR repeat protein